MKNGFLFIRLIMAIMILVIYYLGTVGFKRVGEQVTRLEEK